MYLSTVSIFLYLKKNYTNFYSAKLNSQSSKSEISLEISKISKIYKIVKNKKC